MAKSVCATLPATQSMLEACFFGFAQKYDETLALMHLLHSEIVAKNLSHQLMLLEHEPVITITRQHLLKSLTSTKENIEKSGIALTMADRGGDATFHGPGQLVGYPLIDLRSTKEFIDISAYIRSLEAALFRAVTLLGITRAVLVPGFTGIFIKTYDDAGRLKLKKLVAIGVGVKDGVSKHGFALNVHIDYAHYLQHMIPCGLKDFGVITLKEAFYLESLEMPGYLVIVDTVSLCLSEMFSLPLKWRT